MGDGMLYEEFEPATFLALWEKWRSVGTFTQLRMNPEFWADIMANYENGIYTQMSKIFWQGDTASGDASINFTDGIIKAAAADADVIDVANVGVITQANVISILKNVWAAVPTHLKKRADYAIHMSADDFELLQLANNALKEANDGVLNDDVKRLLLEMPIKEYVGMPKDTILAAEGGSSVKANLVFGVYFDVMGEMNTANVDRVANNSDEWFIKLNYKVGAQYRAGEEIVLYQGV